jgi:hypothetical protein
MLAPIAGAARDGIHQQAARHPQVERVGAGEHWDAHARDKEEAVGIAIPPSALEPRDVRLYASVQTKP